MSVEDAEPGDIYADANGKLWRFYARRGGYGNCQQSRIPLDYTFSALAVHHLAGRRTDPEQA